MSSRRVIASLGSPRLHQIAFEEAPEPSSVEDDTVSSLLDGLLSGSDVAQVTDEFVPPDVAAPLVRIEDGGEPEPPQAFYSLVVERCIDSLAMHACHRTERHWSERHEEEEMLLKMSDAIVACGAGLRTALLEWWQEEIEAPDPWKVWGPLFVLGSIDGGESLSLIDQVLDRLPPTAMREVELAVRALWVAPHPGKSAWLYELKKDDHPVKRAIAVELGARLGGLDAKELLQHLGSDDDVVATAAMRGALHVPRADAGGLNGDHLAQIANRLGSTDSRVAWTASRSLSLLGSDAAYQRLRNDAAFRDVLGPRALELLVMFGDEHDVPLVQPLLNSDNVGEAELNAVARFGHPNTWAFLVHFLADDVLCDAAADALELLFGRLVDEDERLDMTAWRTALGRTQFDPSTRYRCGRPWRPSTLLTAFDEGTLSEVEAQAWLDELVVRTKLDAPIDLTLWTPSAKAAIDAQRNTILRRDQALPAGSWRRL